MTRAHPRSRGADDGVAAPRRTRCGSSPLARGGLSLIEQLMPQDGLIPARAGRTKALHASLRENGAHPRSRGADLSAMGSRLTLAGSSPLARGGRRMHSQMPLGIGLIPARAGRTRNIRL